jgi:hypothetical protein
MLTRRLVVVAGQEPVQGYVARQCFKAMQDSFRPDSISQCQILIGVQIPPVKRGA